MTQTITRLFDDYADATNAIRELEAIGVPHDHLSIVASNADKSHGEHVDQDDDSINDHGDVSRGVSTGAVLGGAGGLLAGLGLLAIPGLGPIVAAGWLAATAAGAGIGAAGGAATGSIVGALKNAGHDENDAHVYAEGVRRGGSLVSAKVPDDLVSEAEAVLERNRSVDAQSRGASYRETGWTSFDDTAPAYTTEQVHEERARYTTGSRL
jgi:hypothetical protein